MQLENLFEQFIASLPGRSPYSLRNYRQRLRHILAEGGGVETLTRERVNEWHEMIVAHGFAQATLGGYRQALKAFCVWLVANGHLAENPASHLRVGKFTPERGVLLPDEADVATVTQLARSWLLGNKVIEIRRACEWLYILESGARRGGVSWLPIAEVRRGLKHGSGGIYRFNSKEKTGPVRHVVGEGVAEALERWLAVRPETDVPQIFTRTWRPCVALKARNITDDFNHLCGAAGVSPIITPHMLRHRVGDKVTREMSPKVAQQKLNHANITTTLLWYHDTSDNDLIQATGVVAVPKEAVVDDSIVREMAALFGVGG